MFDNRRELLASWPAPMAERTPALRLAGEMRHRNDLIGEQ